MRMTLATAIVAVASVLAGADGFMVPFLHEVDLYEPNQNAILAWNGKEEILILSTNVRASKRTKVLQMFASRTKPEVRLVDPSVFMRASEVLKAHDPRKLKPDLPRGAPAAGAAAGAEPAGRIEQHQLLGRHDVAITEVKRPDGFAEWVGDYLKSQGAENLVLPGKLDATIKGYIEKGFHWFVYDIVELNTDVRTNEPLLYRFASDRLFYPLVYTQTMDTSPAIKLLVITRNFLWVYPELPRHNIRVGFEGTNAARADVRDELVTLYPAELGSILVDLVDLMGSANPVRMRQWQLIPEVSGQFEHDLVAR